MVEEKTAATSPMLDDLSLDYKSTQSRQSTPKHELMGPTLKKDSSKKLKINLHSIKEVQNTALNGPVLHSPSPTSIFNSARFSSRSPPRRSLGHGTPPRSPRSPHQAAHQARKHTPKRLPQIKQFYFPNGVPVSPNTAIQEQKQINKVFMLHKDGDLPEEIFNELTVKVCGFSTYCNRTLFNKLDTSNKGKVSKDAFCKFWSTKLQTFDRTARLFELLRKEDRLYLIRDDFKTLVREILDRHPGLQFLQSSPGFHSRYVETVIGRIFYHVNKSGTEKLTDGELKRSSFPETLLTLDNESDINEVFDFFSYEHFYVIYCKFWELDDDHDFEIDQEALLKYGENCHTKAIVDRITEGAPKKLRSGKPGILNYEDFIPFIISAEDKTSQISIDYWFKCLDLDGDGVIAPYEIEHFFKEQQLRIKHFSNETVQFRDFLCQLNDMIKPKEEARFTRQDVKNSKLAGLFFDMIFNLSKFALYEARDPIHIEDKRRTPHMTDWDRFAASEYTQYANEEDSNSRIDDSDTELGDICDISEDQSSGSEVSGP